MFINIYIILQQRWTNRDRINKLLSIYSKALIFVATKFETKYIIMNYWYFHYITWKVSHNNKKHLLPPASAAGVMIAAIKGTYYHINLKQLEILRRKKCVQKATQALNHAQLETIEIWDTDAPYPQPLNRKLMSAMHDICTYDTTYTYSISNHSRKWLPSFDHEKLCKIM